MRRWMFLLCLVLAAPSAAAQDTIPVPDVPEPADTVSADPVEVDRPVPAIPRFGESAALEQRAQPSSQQFLYQILLTAVGALVTALIWKWVN